MQNIRMFTSEHPVEHVGIMHSRNRLQLIFYQLKTHIRELIYVHIQIQVTM
jgi:hypothetical protein